MKAGRERAKVGEESCVSGSLHPLKTFRISVSNHLKISTKFPTSPSSLTRSVHLLNAQASLCIHTLFPQIKKGVIISQN